MPRDSEFRYVSTMRQELGDPALRITRANLHPSPIEEPHAKDSAAVMQRDGAAHTHHIQTLEKQRGLLADSGTSWVNRGKGGLDALDHDPDYEWSR